MNNIDYGAMLYEKMKNEQNSYRKQLLSQQPAEILNHTYEYTTREDILMCMEEVPLQPRQAKAMLKSPCPLKDVYEEFRDRETGYMDTIRESIEAESDRSIHREKQRASREDRQIYEHQKPYGRGQLCRILVMPKSILDCAIVLEKTGIFFCAWERK